MVFFFVVVVVCSQVFGRPPACERDRPDQRGSDPKAAGDPGGAGPKTGPGGQKPNQVGRQA